MLGSTLRCLVEMSASLSRSSLSPAEERNKVCLAGCVSRESTTSFAKSSEAICLIICSWIYARVDVMCLGIKSLKFTSLPLLKIWTTFVNLLSSGAMPAFCNSSRIADTGSMTTSACSFHTLGSDVQLRKPQLIHCGHFLCLSPSNSGNNPLPFIYLLYVVFLLGK